MMTKFEILTELNGNSEIIQKISKATQGCSKSAAVAAYQGESGYLVVAEIPVDHFLMGGAVYFGNEPLTSAEVARSIEEKIGDFDYFGWDKG